MEKYIFDKVLDNVKELPMLINGLRAPKAEETENGLGTFRGEEASEDKQSE